MRSEANCLPAGIVQAVRAGPSSLWAGLRKTGLPFWYHELGDTYLGNVEQNDSKNIYPAKHVLSRVEGTPRRKDLNLNFEIRNKFQGQ